MAGVCPGPCCPECTPCDNTICVTGCNGDPVVGASVSVYQGATLVASCTTVTSGENACCTVTICPGAYTVVVSATCYVTSTTTVTFTCSIATIALTASGDCTCSGSCWTDCCGQHVAIPNTLIVNDGLGDITMTYQGGGVWTGCATRTANNVCLQQENPTVDLNCWDQVIDYADGATISVTVYFTLSCTVDLLGHCTGFSFSGVVCTCTETTNGWLTGNSCSDSCPASSAVILGVNLTINSCYPMDLTGTDSFGSHGAFAWCTPNGYAIYGSTASVTVTP